MKQATWHDTVVAQSDDIVVVEGNPYFPDASRVTAHFKPSPKTTECPWKGTAHYYDVVVGDAVNPDAAWYYPDPKPAAKEIKGRVAFWRGVRVSG